MYPSSRFSNLLVLLYLSAFVAGIPQNRPNVDVVTHNNYQIYNCGDRAPAVQSLLDLTARYLRNALTATTPSNPVYATYFHGVPPTKVRTILRKIISGASIQVRGNGFEPVIMCASPSTPNMAPFMARCLVPGVRAGSVPKTPFTFICPDFTNLPSIPPSDGCPEVLRGKWLSGGFNMAFSQVTILVHELAHIYLGKECLTPEVYDMNPAMRLRPEAAVRNAQNYALFIGNLAAGCTNFPTNRALGRDHELLEVDAETRYSSETLQLAPGCPSGSVQAVLGLCQAGA